ncbi:MAG: tRNA pseudouridine(13) synthase TruD [Pseudomonadota bacterium]
MPAPLARAHGEPLGTATIRTVPEDFFVDEELPFVPDGAGEHLLVQVEKRGQNTGWVAQELSRFAGVHPRLVSFSGRKDRHAVTRQWFSIQLTARPDPDWSQLALDGVRVLASHRHSRKLRTGTHRINRFVLVLRGIRADAAAVEARLALIAEQGIPDYFGEQRFGLDDGNVALAREAVATGRLPSRPEKRGMVISTLRSLIFNEVLDARVRDGSWNRILPGELVMLDGTGGRWFAGDGDPTLADRCRVLDVHPGGPLAGSGGAQPTGAVAELEGRLTGRYDGELAALHQWRVESGRRALRCRVRELRHEWPEPGVLRLAFTLGRGSYATAVLRELFDVNDAAGFAVTRETDSE